MLRLPTPAPWQSLSANCLASFFFRVFLLNNFKPHVTSPTLYRGTRLSVDLSAVRRDDVEIEGTDGRNWAGIGRRDCPTCKSRAAGGLPCPVPFAKIFLFFRNTNQSI